jgi:hypothetical protein
MFSGGKITDGMESSLAQQCNIELDNEAVKIDI